MVYEHYNLESNPFKVADRRIEKGYKWFSEIQLVPTKTVKEIVFLVEDESSKIYEGERGCGKTSAIERAWFELNTKPQPTDPEARRFFAFTQLPVIVWAICFDNFTIISRIRFQTKKLNPFGRP